MSNFEHDMKEVDFVELAIYCQKQFEAHHIAKDERYIGTVFVSIQENNEVKFSKTPHILSNAHQCILIHEWSKLAYTNWYSWHKVEIINEDGCIHDDHLDEDFRLCVASVGSYSNQIMNLRYGNQIDLYWFRWTSEQERI